MKLIEKNTNSVVEICMYMVDGDKTPSQQDISAYIFDASVEGANDEGEWFVADVDACIDFAKDWVNGTGDFCYDDDAVGDYADEDGFHVYERQDYRMAVIDGMMFTNYNL